MVYDASDIHGGDHAFIDGVETLTFVARDYDQGVDASVASVKGVRADLSRPDIQAMGAGLSTSPEDGAWEIWDSTLDGQTPSNGDTITRSADSSVWTIGAISERLTEPRWVVLCRKQH